MGSRRNFIKKSMVVATGLLFADHAISMNFVSNSKLRKIGFIAGIVDKEMKADWKGTLKKVVAFGFSEIEGGDEYAPSVKDFVTYCKEIGIKPIASGIDFTATADQLQAEFDRINVLGVKYVVIYWPWLTGGPFTLEDCKKSARMLNEVGAQAKANGLSLLWHNHDLEFHIMEKGLPFDYLMENTDPQLVQCEMDIYWVKKGGGDPLQVLRKYAGRISVLHVKDMAPDGDFICPGRGIIDFVPIFREAEKQGIKHYMVERDNEPEGIGCLESSAEFLKNISF
jgi:sugar phosphate isomerase/epimerase